MTVQSNEGSSNSLKHTLISLSLIGAMSGCAVADQIKPTFPVSDEPTTVETAVGIGVGAVLVATAVFMITLAAVVKDAAE